MQPLELVAVALVVACVLLAVKRSLWQYPIGIAGTLLYIVVFLQAKLYASAWLNVFFTLAQIYGWWFWLRGDEGKRPKVAAWGWPTTGAVCVAGLAIAALFGFALVQLTDAALPFMDATIFGLSVAAQFLLDRKKIENWAVWGVVNLLSVWTYANQGLWPTAVLYAALFVNVFWGWYEWRKAMHADQLANSASVSTAT